VRRTIRRRGPLRPRHRRQRNRLSRHRCTALRINSR
jgi:hypothetical protein